MAGMVVLHVSDHPDDVARGLSAAGLIAQSEPMRVRVIVNGPAVTELVRTGPGSREPIPSPEGVSILACQRGLRAQGFNADDLRPGVGSVPSAVIALANAQHEGAAYIRI